MKKLLALTLALALVLALSTMAFATQSIGTASATTGTVTITNAEIGETYQAYQIFTATVARDDNNTATDPSDDTASSISYRWAGSGTMPANSYFTEDAAGNITQTAAAGDASTQNGLSAGAIELIRGWVEGGQITFPTAAQNPVTATDTTLAFNGLDYGYWYVTSTLGTVVTINSTYPNASVVDKNTKPTLEKFVEEDSTSNFGKQNDAEYGQTVNFKIVIDAKKGAKNYVLYDLMDSGFTFDGVTSIHVYLNGSSTQTEIPATETVSGNDVTNWTAATGGTYPDGATPATTATFRVTFAQDFLNRMEDSNHIIVTYTAKLNNTAAINTAIPNDAIMTYGANNSATAPDETNTFVWGAKIYKYTGTLGGADETALSDAEFVICKHVTDGSVKHAFATFDAYGKFAGWTQLYPSSANVAQQGDPYFDESDIPTMSSADFTTLGATVLTTNALGEIDLTGLDEGTYHVIETKAPDGYNKLNTAQDITISSSGDRTQIATPLSSGTNGVTELDIQNNAGTVLPSTGGIGTTIFYIVGGLLVAGAVVLLITKKRMNNE